LAAECSLGFAQRETNSAPFSPEAFLCGPLIEPPHKAPNLKHPARLTTTKSRGTNTEKCDSLESAIPLVSACCPRD
jgi:hypothetical protein